MEQGKGKNRNNATVTKGTTQDKGSNKVMDSGRSSRDGKRDGDCKGTLRDAVNGMKSMDVSHDKQKDGDVLQDVSQKSKNLKNNHVIPQSSNPGGDKTSKKVEKIEPIPEKVKTNANNGNANRSVDSSSKTKADTPKYSDNDFPALASTVEKPASSKAGPSAQNSEQQFSNQLTRKKAAAISTVKVPAAKRNYNEEFPSLSAMSNIQDKTGNSAVKAPPGLPVPGAHRPPPGLKWSVPPPGLAPTGNGMASVVNTENSSARARKRDQQLIREVTFILDSKGQSFQRFQEVSGQFRMGNLSAEGYYRECCGMLGEENVHRVFKGLIDLLPDEEKQRQLLMVYNDAKVRSKQVKPEIGVSPTQRFTDSNIASSTGVLLQTGDFPALPKSSGKNSMRSQQKVSDAWVRGR